MIARQRRILDKDVLSPWLMRDILNEYSNSPCPNICVRSTRVVKLLKYLKLDDGSLLCSISDSNFAMMAIITQDCIRSYEVVNRCRITEFTTNTIVLLLDAHVEWLQPRQFYSMFGNVVKEMKCHSFAVLKIKRLEVYDGDQDPLRIMLKLIYEEKEYLDTVTPFVTDLMIDS